MEEYEKIIVESDEETGADVYNRVIIDVLSDLALGRVLEKIRAYIDVKEPVFIFVALRRFGLPSIRLSDFAEVDMGDYGKNEVTINLLKESYIPQLLNKLWERYGKGNIDHSERSMIIVHTPDYFTEVDFLREMVIDEKIAQINDRIMDAMLRIIPEGFRVRYHQLTEEYVLFVASEDPIKQEWKDKAFSIRNGLVKGGKDNA
ncbi:MAG: hypothetical protein C5S41_10555 [Candidatus Methanomarinus sp.]|nr:MAG: hypothetical protein C5S41_10555 [ANME-2 cluster archaeon]